MEYSNNPQSVVNGYHSSTRNVLLASSIAIAVYSFSETFTITSSENITKIISMLIFLQSILYGINSTFSYYRYINIIENRKNVPKYIDINFMKRDIYIVSTYIFILIILFLIALRRMLNRVFF